MNHLFCHAERDLLETNGELHGAETKGRTVRHHGPYVRRDAMSVYEGAVVRLLVAHMQMAGLHLESAVHARNAWLREHDLTLRGVASDQHFEAGHHRVKHPSAREAGARRVTERGSLALRVRIGRRRL